MILRLATAVFASAAFAAAPAFAQDPGASRPRNLGPALPGSSDAAAERVERRTQEIQDKAAPAVASLRAIVAKLALPKIELPGLVLLPPCRQTPQETEATAFLVSNQGHFVTTFDAVRGATFFEVRFADGTVRDAELVGFDQPFRVAVLRTAAPAGAERLAETADLSPGRKELAWLLAAPDGAGQAPVQIAAVRAATRSDGVYDRYLTSRVSLVPGAAGGPLLSEDGLLLGMAVGMTSHCSAVQGEAPKPPTGATAAVTPAATTSSPAPSPTKVCRSALFVRGDDVLRAVEQIARIGHVRRAKLGVLLDGESARVDHVLPGGPAELAGMREGDVVTSIGGEPVTNAAEIGRHCLRRDIGESVSVTFRRGLTELERQVVLDDSRMPGLPTRRPLEGGTLQVAMAGEDRAARADGGHVATARWAVTFLAVDADGPLARAGVQAGDELVSVDATDALRFIDRHRIRPAEVAPATLEVLRGGEKRTVVLRQ